MGLVNLTGRLLFAFLFLSSGAQKLSSFNLSNGGPTMEFMAPKLDTAIGSLQRILGQSLDIPKAWYVYALGVAIFLELAGGVLFVLGSNLGAWLLMAFLGVVTPVMHNWWDLKEGSEEQITDMVQFFKNVALLGSLLIFVSARSSPKYKLA